jgi:hypothetical protein
MGVDRCRHHLRFDQRRPQRRHRGTARRTGSQLPDQDQCRPRRLYRP